MAVKSPAEWQTVYEALQGKLSQDLYWDNFDPRLGPPEILIANSLSDDLADIWRDMKNGILNLQSEYASTNDVWWEWRFSFYSHWGSHAIGALRALHYILSDT